MTNDNDILVVKAIVDENPNYYLDEIAFFFGMQTGTFVHHSTIRRCLVDRLGYSMKVLQTIAKQQCEVDEILFLQAMEIHLQSDVTKIGMRLEGDGDRDIKGIAVG